MSAIAGRVQGALAYGTDHPYGEFTTEETVNKVTLADVEKFYADYFVPANAYIIVIGDVNFKEVQKLVKKNFTPWTKAAPPFFYILQTNGRTVYTNKLCRCTQCSTIRDSGGEYC